MPRVVSDRPGRSVPGGVGGRDPLSLGARDLIWPFAIGLPARRGLTSLFRGSYVPTARSRSTWNSPRIGDTTGFTGTA
jgi:hypothetical protein